MGITRDDLKNNIILLDGAMGTMIQNSGARISECPEDMNIDNSGVIVEIHRKYALSGADIMTTNTFGANSKKIENSRYSLDELIKAAVENAKEGAAVTNASVALDIGPIGELLEPMGTLTFDEAYEIFKEVVLLGEKYNVDLYIIETMADLNEARAAVLAVKENSDKMVICTMTFDEDGRTFTGVSPEAMCLSLNGLGVDAIGVNCSVGPAQLKNVVSRILNRSTCPVIVQPNAGLPRDENGKTVYDIGMNEFVDCMTDFIDDGVAIVGGCCGTTDEYIKLLHSAIQSKKRVKKEIKKTSAVSSATKVVDINGVRAIGERINPTGKKLFKEELRKGNIDYIIKEALKQVECGADILDINLGLPEINEKEMMVRVIKEIQSVTDIPLQIDSMDPEVIEAALRIYNGKAIVNSVNGEQKSLKNILPIVKKYGASVVALTLDERGLPKTAEDRIEIAERIVKRAEEEGIDRSDIFIDCLTLTVSSMQNQAIETIKAVKYVSEVMKLNTVLGVSNISFGLPNRELLNNTFLTMCMNSGLTLPIVNPVSEETMNTIRAFRVFNLEDIDETAFIEHFNTEKKTNKSNEKVLAPTDLDLKEIVIKGLKEEAADKTTELLKEKTELDIVNEYLIPALNIVGDKYEKGIIFLPQLIGSAETVKRAFAVLKESISKNNRNSISKGKIAMATVKGDIHDIGKNIVKVILENYGYEMIDLGRDVDIERVVECVKENNLKLLGLSALMTTTVKSMEQTIKEVRKVSDKCSIMVGGAVLTQEYADMIGADYYAKDANASVMIAEKVFSCDNIKTND